MSPGASTGVLSWVGDSVSPFNPAASAVLEIEIGGPSPGTEHDQLAVTGAAELGGTLTLSVTGDRLTAQAEHWAWLTNAQSVDLDNLPAAQVQFALLPNLLADLGRQAALSVHLPRIPPNRSGKDDVRDFPRRYLYQ